MGPVVALYSDKGLVVLCSLTSKLRSVRSIAVFGPPVIVACHEGERRVGEGAGVVLKNGTASTIII